MRIGLALCATLAALGGCGNPADMEEIKKGQKDILAKVESLEKAIAQVKAAPAAAARPAIDPNKVYTIPIGDSPMRGPKNAKVTIVEFSDFQCPFCSQAAALVPDVLKAYPNDVNFVYKQFPLVSIHPFAMPAAKAAVAAGKQGKFWEMHDVLFQNNRELGPDKLKEYAGRIGLDVARWEKDLASPEVQAQVEREMKEASAADVQGTPTFLVAGKRLQTRSIDGFKQAIDEALKPKT
ncbi:MAG: thioredoxin domain-containing protein [Candidatus Binatia bacterium]